LNVVSVEPYSRNWARRFERQAKALKIALGSQSSEIEHIGSTAIPGLAAKPIIDIAARAATGVDPFALASAIACLGYFPHLSGPKTHAVYIRGTDADRTEILHVFDWDDWPQCNQRVFRDKLLDDASSRRRYGELKIHLAESLSNGMDYTEAKRELIQELLNEEQASRGTPLTLAWDK
jgi:GrpB-like predicted nucleotidyltransferase (UPF0157 family)